MIGVYDCVYMCMHAWICSGMCVIERLCVMCVCLSVCLSVGVCVCVCVCVCVSGCGCKWERANAHMRVDVCLIGTANGIEC